MHRDTAQPIAYQYLTRVKLVACGMRTFVVASSFSSRIFFLTSFVQTLKLKSRKNSPTFRTVQMIPFGA